jgi:hypothetical protein
MRILREAGLHLLHGIRIGLIQSLAIGVRVGRMPLRKRFHQGALQVSAARGKGSGPFKHDQSTRIRVGIHRVVDMWTENPCLTPETHGAGGIELLRSPKGPRSLGMIEPPPQAIALVEVGLGLAARILGHKPGQIAQIRMQRRLVLGAWRSCATRKVAAIGTEFGALGLCILRLWLQLRDRQVMARAMMVWLLQSMQHANARTVMIAERTGIGRTPCHQGQDRRCREKA